MFSLLLSSLFFMELSVTDDELRSQSVCSTSAGRIQKNSGKTFSNPIETIHFKGPKTLFQWTSNLIVSMKMVNIIGSAQRLLIKKTS